MKKSIVFEWVVFTCAKQPTGPRSVPGGLGALVFHEVGAGVASLHKSVSAVSLHKYCNSAQVNRC